MTLYEWLQGISFSSDCCIDIVTVSDNGSYHQLEANEPALKDDHYTRFAKRFSEVTYKELQPYLDLVYESSGVYSSSDLIIVEVKVKSKE